MTEPHRATPEQWAIVASEAADGSATHSCMLELNDTLRALCRARNDLVVCNTEQNQRIEALEAAQLEQAGSHRFCTDAIVRRVEVLELAHRIQSGTLTSAERAELGVVTRVQLEAAMLRSASDARQTAMDELRAASAEAQPGSLLERVANAIYNVPHDSAAEARAAIREVAAWLTENDSECQMGGDAAATAELLEQEASQ
jgi:hypothetical protein